MKRLDIITLVVLGIIALSLVLSLFKSTSVSVEGYTQQEVDMMLEIQALKNDKKQFKYEVYRFKESIVQDSIYVSTVSNKSIDSLYAEYFGQP